MGVTPKNEWIVVEAEQENMSASKAMDKVIEFEAKYKTNEIVFAKSFFKQVEGVIEEIEEASGIFLGNVIPVSDSVLEVKAKIQTLDIRTSKMRVSTEAKQKDELKLQFGSWTVDGPASRYTQIAVAIALFSTKDVVSRRENFEESSYFDSEDEFEHNFY